MPGGVNRGCSVPIKALLAPADTQLTFTCSKSAIERLEKGVKYVQNYNILHIFFAVSIVDFEQGNVSWVY